MASELYLGDGLYVSHDGWAYKLRAPRQEGDHVVFLDERMLRLLVDYAAKISGAEDAAE